jgi:hypothetical protein
MLPLPNKIQTIRLIRFSGASLLDIGFTHDSVMHHLIPTVLVRAL